MQENLIQCFNAVKECFVWKSDLETKGIGESWDDFYDHVGGNGIASGDCDDFALTILIAGIKDFGFDPEKCRIARVLTEAGDRSTAFDHAVAIYDGVVFDNRQRSPIAISRLLSVYEFYDYCKIPITEWFQYDTADQFHKHGTWL